MISSFLTGFTSDNLCLGKNKPVNFPAEVANPDLGSTISPSDFSPNLVLASPNLAAWDLGQVSPHTIYIDSADYHLFLSQEVLLGSDHNDVHSTVMPGSSKASLLTSKWCWWWTGIITWASQDDRSKLLPSCLNAKEQGLGLLQDFLLHQQQDPNRCLFFTPSSKETLFLVVLKC